MPYRQSTPATSATRRPASIYITPLRWRWLGSVTIERRGSVKWLPMQCFAIRSRMKSLQGLRIGTGAYGSLQGRRIVICKAFLIDDIEQHQPPGGSTPGGEVNVSLFAVGDCCGCPTKGAADRRQSVPPATAAAPAPTQTTATPRGCRPAFLGSGVSVVRWLANLCAHLKPETVLRWHRRGWRTYWWRDR